jgi:hypothetical protein
MKVFGESCLKKQGAVYSPKYGDRQGNNKTARLKMGHRLGNQAISSKKSLALVMLGKNSASQ